MVHIRYEDNEIKNNVLAIYELDAEHRPTICPLINCDYNKRFIRNYNKLSDPSCNTNDLSNKNGVIDFHYENSFNTICALQLDRKQITLHNKDNQNLYDNNMRFIEYLDDIISKSYTYKEHNVDIDKFKLMKLSDRSTNLFKGLKYFLVDSKDKNVEGVICSQEIQLPYYNSTSTNIYKGCVYSTAYSLEKGCKGHLFIITPDDDEKCIDYISFINSKTNTHKNIYCGAYNLPSTSTNQHEFKQLLNNNNLEPQQFNVDKKYMYEQEVLFGRYTKLSNIVFLGKINFIYAQGNDTLYEYIDNTNIICYTTHSDVVKLITQYEFVTHENTNGLKQLNIYYKQKNKLIILYDNGELSYLDNSKYICKTHAYYGFGPRIDAINVFTDGPRKELNFSSKYNLDPDKEPIMTILHTLGTNVYKCKLTNNLPSIIYSCTVSTAGGNGNNNQINNYYQKYLKYKMKYLELKK